MRRRLCAVGLLAVAIGWPGTVSAQDVVVTPVLPLAPVLPPAAPSESPRPDGGYVGLFFAVRPAAFVPFGSWTEHVLAGKTTGDVTHPDDLTQFGPGGGGVVELGWWYEDWVGFAFLVDMTSLSTGDWDDYVASRGERVESWAMRWAFDMVVVMAAVDSDGFRLEPRLGLGYQQAYALERNREYELTYNYGFLKPALSVRGGVAFGLLLDEDLEVQAVADFVAAASGGLEYEEEEWPRWVMGMSFSLGIRWTLGML